MKAWKRFGLLTLAAGGVVSLASGARADTLGTITATVNTPAPADIVYITDTGLGVNNVECYAGQINWTLDSESTTGLLGSGVSVGGSFGTYCVDIQNDISINNPYTYSVVDNGTTASLDSLRGITSAGQVTQIEELWSLAPGHADGGINANDFAAAFQISIWDIIYNNGNTSGGLSVNDNTATATQVSTFLTAVKAEGGTGPVTNLLGLSSTTAQDQALTAPPGVGSGPPTPLPKPLAGGVVLFGALGAFARLRRRSSKTPVPVLA